VIQQGHPYTYFGRKVIALASGTSRVPVLAIHPSPMRWESFDVHAADLRPLPLRYLHGEMA